MPPIRVRPSGSASPANWYSRLWIVLALLPGLWALFIRVPVPIDETRYLTVAWEMWLRHDLLVLHLNGAPYSHKPPVLFWLIQAGWALFGVNEWWPRLIGPLSSVAAIGIATRLARTLWPQDSATADRVPWILAGSVGWLSLSQMLMFDMLLTGSVLVGLLGIWKAGHSGHTRDWGMVAVAIGVGLLIKGPVIFVHVLVPALLAPLWSQRARNNPGGWIAACIVTALGGTAIAALWAIPAAIAGGAEYGAAILWGQTTGRMTNSFAHARGPWFYLLILPAMLLPWSLGLRPWRQLRAGVTADTGGRFLSTWLGSVFLILTLISGKQLHYLLPLLPPAALLLARGGGHVNGIRDFRLPAIALIVVLVVMSSATVYFSRYAPGLDLRRPAAAVAVLRQSGAEVAALAPYQGQLTFLARDERTLAEVPAGELAGWTAAHPDAYVLTFDDLPTAGLPLQPVASYPYGSEILTIWQVTKTLTAPPAAAPNGAHHE